MDNPYAKLAMTVGHETLFKKSVSREEVVEIIAKYPATLWLDIFSKIDGFLILPKKKDFNVQNYLTDRIFAPSVLTRINNQKIQNGFYFSLGQLNLARKLAILHGTENTTAIDMPAKTELSKVLLGAQDFHNKFDEGSVKPNDLVEFCKFSIRNGYLNMNMNLIFGSLYSRAHRMYILSSQEIPFAENVNFLDFFQEKVGLTPEHAMALNFSLAVPFLQEQENFWDKHTIIDPNTFFAGIIIDPAHVNSIINSLTIDFGDLKSKIATELNEVNFSQKPVGYNMEIFRKTPLVRLSDGRYLCVSLSSLFEKSTQNIMWMPLKNVTETEERKKLVSDLMSYRGRLFENYVKRLCSIQAEKNNNVRFVYIPPEATDDSEEVGDCILVQGDEIVVFEAKSRQFNEPFKYSGDWESGDPRFITELINKASDQIAKATQKILDGRIQDFPIDPTTIRRVHPVVVTYDPVPMFGKMQKFLRQKVAEAGHLSNQIFAPFEIINISDLEEVMDSADTLTFIDLLNVKNSTNNLDSSESDFHNFLCHYVEQNTVIGNGWQREQAGG